MLTVKQQPGSIPQINIDVDELTTALSASIDLTAQVNRDHSVRTTYLSVTLAKALRLSEKDVIDIYFASLLHDMVPEDSIFSEESVFAMLELLPLAKSVARCVSDLYHHKSECQAQPHLFECVDYRCKILFIAEQFESRWAADQDDLRQRQAYRNWICREVRLWDEKIASILDYYISMEGFWQDLKTGMIRTALQRIKPQHRRSLGINDLEKVSMAFAALIDQKSPYTGSHSRRVGEIAAASVSSCGYDRFTTQKVKIAGYLHDLGKLAVPDYILNKSGPLSEQEKQIIMAHPYHTAAILGKIKGLEDIAEWAGNHHERINGSGYPRKKVDLTLIDQIMAVSDIYEALTAVRPYRDAMKQGEAFHVLEKMAWSGEIMKGAVNAVEKTVKKNRL